MSDSSADDAARKERQREYGRRWRAANAEKLKAQKRQYYLDNRERIRAEQNERYASDPAARERIGRTNREWQRANRQRVREYKADWYEANGDRLRERARQYREENREALKEDAAKRYAANPERWWASGLKRRHGVDASTWVRIWQEQDGRCYLCNRELNFSSTRKVVVEHWHGCASHDPEFSCNACRRGLSCAGCNVTLGAAGDDPELLRLIADNLEAANRSVQQRQAIAPRQLQLEFE